MLEQLLLVSVAGLVGGVMAHRLGLPRLIGMMLAGMAVGPYGAKWISPAIFASFDDVRTIALLTILFRAGLGIDRNRLVERGTVAFRLGILPALSEAVVVAALATRVLGWPWPVALVLGWVLAAESPAVIVPMMLRFKAEGLGSRRGVPDLLMAGAALSDVLAVTMFGVCMNTAMRSGTSGWIALLEMPLEVGLGLGAGYLASRMVRLVLYHSRLADNTAHDLVWVLSIGIGLIALARTLPFSGLLAIMSMGFALQEADPVLARRLRDRFDRFWTAVEILLFTLLGASVMPTSLGAAGAHAGLIVGLGLLLGRVPGVLLALWGGGLTRREQMFLLCAETPKATVQAAIGGLPMALGLVHGESILSLSAWAIVFTAPLGSFLTAWAAPRLLEREEDVTSVSIIGSPTLLVGLDGSEPSIRALERAAALARRVDGRLLIVHVNGSRPLTSLAIFEPVAAQVKDIDYQYEVVSGNAVEVISELAERLSVDYVFLGKTGRSSLGRLLLGSVSRTLAETLTIPVILVD